MPTNTDLSSPVSLGVLSRSIEIHKISSFPNNLEHQSYDTNRRRSMDISRFNNRSPELQTESGIAHIGCGNFHRSHQEYYLNQLLKANYEENKNWLYTGIGVLPNDIKLKDKLKKNNFKYHIISLNNEGKAEIEHINTLKNVLVTCENTESCIDTLINPAIKIVSLTITEYGYSIPLNDKDIELIHNALEINDYSENDDLEMDMDADTDTDTDNDNTKLNTCDEKDTSQNISAFGLIIAALAFRYKNNIRPFTIMSCDNLISNGDICKNKCMEELSKINDECFKIWMMEEVKYPNTMVDRITPFINEQEIIDLEKKYTIIDSSPVVCENYKSWIIEDNFVDNCRPKWENVGTIMTDNVKPYEYMKLCLLNIPHSFVAYCGLVKDYVYVHEVMQDPELVVKVKKFITEDIIPVIEKEIDICEIDYVQYSEDVLKRFSNEHMKDKLTRIAQDGMDKFKNQGLPILLKGIKMNLKMLNFRTYIENWFNYEKISYGDPILNTVESWVDTWFKDNEKK